MQIGWGGNIASGSCVVVEVVVVGDVVEVEGALIFVVVEGIAVEAKVGRLVAVNFSVVTATFEHYVWDTTAVINNLLKYY